MRSRRYLLLLCFMTTATCLVLDFSSAAQSATTPQETSFRVAGLLVSKTDGHPLAGAHVILANTKDRPNTQSVTTSDDGRFEFSGVPAGKFSLTGAKRGFIFAGYDQHDQYATAIVTGAGVDTENLVLKLSPQALIGGRVLDEASEPVRNASVTLYRDNHLEGVHEIQTFRIAQTNDLGNFEVDEVAPGMYFLAVDAQPWYAIHPSGPAPASVDPAFDVSYPVTYYGDVMEPESASPITVRGGERLQLDLHLNPVPSLHLLLHVPASQPNQYSFAQLEHSSFNGSVPVRAATTGMSSSGTWEISGIPAGKYNVRLIGQNGAQLNGIEVNGTNQEFDASSAEALCTLNVTLTAGTQASAPFSVLLRSRNGPSATMKMADSKGQAKFENLAPGRYELEILSQGRAVGIAGISAEGGSISGRSITLAAGAAATVSLSLGTGNAEVQGIAKLAGKPFAGAMVVLVPTNQDGNIDLFRRDQSDLDGTFIFHNVLPGSYRVVAIEDGWDLDWSQPEVIAGYAKRGIPFQVADKAGQSLTLPAAVEVQSK
jgi:hypothetical protein